MAVQGERISVRSLVEPAFLERWQDLGGGELGPEEIELISENFNLDRIEDEIYAEMAQLPGQNAALAWERHLQLLDHLARQFAEQLYQTSGQGRTIESEAILEAKTRLREE